MRFVSSVPSLIVMSISHPFENFVFNSSILKYSSNLNKMVTENSRVHVDIRALVLRHLRLKKLIKSESDHCFTENLSFT